MTSIRSVGVGNTTPAASGLPLPLLLDSRPGVHLFTLWDPHLQTDPEPQGKWGWWTTWLRFLFGEEFGGHVGHPSRDRMPVGRDPIRLGCLRQRDTVHT